MESYWIYLLIALALALDAFAVSIAAGAYYVKASNHQRFRLSFHFGLFQFIMPIIGWFLGIEVVELINEFDHWIAMVILAIIGIKMIYDGLDNSDNVIKKDISKGWSLILLSIATSIDALAVGFSIGIIKETIIVPSIMIGIVAALMTLLGIWIGEKLSFKYGKRISILGGLILIIIGLKILNEHLQLI